MPNSIILGLLSLITKDDDPLFMGLMHGIFQFRWTSCIQSSMFYSMYFFNVTVSPTRASRVVFRLVTM